MRLLVTALVLVALALAGCSHDEELKESPEQIQSEQAAADAHNASTIPSPDDGESPSSTDPVTSTIPIVFGGERLFTGDCVDRPTGDAVEVRDISCEKPHHAEVTARVDVDPRFGNVYPTDAQLLDVQKTDCLRAFENYVGQAPTADLLVGLYGPPEGTWDNPGQRYVICLASARASEGNVLTRSVRKPR